MWGRRDCRPRWRSHARDAVYAKDAEKEDEPVEEPPQPGDSLTHASVFLGTVSRKPSSITVPSPSVTSMPKTASAASSSASAASPADDANGLSSHRSLRPPLVVCEGEGEAGSPAAHHCSRHATRARPPLTPTSSRSSNHSSHTASAHLDAQQLQPLDQGNNDATVPVTHWRAASALTSVPTGLGPDSAALGARHCSADQEHHHTITMSNSAVLEHYHVLDLEEQLQYWRQRALQVEDRALLRERALQARWEAEFDAAQASSETLIRKLLGKVRRLPTQVTVRKCAVQQREGQDPQSRSRNASMDSTSTTSSLSTPGNSGHHAPERQQLRHRPHRSSQRLQNEHHPRPLTEASHHGDNACEGMHGVPRGSGTSSVTCQRRPVSQLADENASLLESPAGLQREQQNSGRSRSAAYAAEDCATYHEKPNVTLQAHLRNLFRVVLGCLSRSSELRECRAVLCRKFSDDSQAADDDDSEEPQTAPVVEALLDALSELQTNEAPSSSSLGQSLLVLQNSLEHLDMVLRTCVDDIVFASSAITSASSATYVRHQQRQPLQGENCNADLEVQLRQARAALFHEQHCRATVQSSLDAAMRDMQNLAQAHQDTVLQLKVEARAAVEEAQQAYHAALERTRVALERDVVAATRQASAAQNQSMMRTQQEVHWQTRLSALEKERDSYARECSLLKSQLELLRQTISTVAAERAGHQRESVDKALRSVMSRDGVEGNATAATASALMVPQIGTSSPGPHVMWTDDQMTRRTATGEPSGLASLSSVCRSPRRSLSYSPSPGTEKVLKRAPSARADATPRTHSAQRRRCASTAESSAPPLPSASPSLPMNVVQPSVLAMPEDYEDTEVSALAQRPYGSNRSAERGKAGVTVDGKALESAHFSPWLGSLRQCAPTVIDAASVSTPLVTMRKWEEKFKALLSSA
ncbi:hypothetical protein, conserved [Leishmania tarentolae]|uniref:Uncharacterized protein n=1 Tax=Leishmania tarentolae TaxID=5689 RepID=A0A640KCI0_LEITA|nr:hypothetical protein, conserved [Leishmania tarentolae]